VLRDYPFRKIGDLGVPLTKKSDSRRDKSRPYCRDVSMWLSPDERTIFVRGIFGSLMTVRCEKDLTVGFFLGMDVDIWRCTACQRVEKRSKSGGTLMMSSNVTRILRNVPLATLVKGDSYVVDPKNKVKQNFESQGLERRVKQEFSSTETLKP
jgi:hypothetical protein